MVPLRRKSWCSITAFLTIQTITLFVITINKINKHKSSKSICSSDFGNLYIKAPRYKLLEVLRENIGLTFKKG